MLLGRRLLKLLGREAKGLLLGWDLLLLDWLLESCLELLLGRQLLLKEWIRLGLGLLLDHRLAVSSHNVK